MELMNAKLRPLGDKILIKLENMEKKTKSGIVLPDTAKEKPQIGTVVAVGTGKILENGQKVEITDVQVGTKVIYSKYAGTELKINDEDHILLSVDDILAIVE